MTTLGSVSLAFTAVCAAFVIWVFTKAYRGERERERRQDLEMERMRLAHFERLETKTIEELGRQIIGTPRRGEPEPIFERQPDGPGTGQEPLFVEDEWNTHDPTDDDIPDDPIPPRGSTPVSDELPMTLTVELPRDLYNGIRAQAERRGLTVSEMVEQALTVAMFIPHDD